ncbi:trypsin-like peptidase domain-containing protein [Pelagovum pacificum]|uniref:Peptidoglycan-binding protein n=1 Tax=Pelagovum pacificum TaxID=2588711 RepID=A0A5C5GG07_9RHOB|nr:trypsin-like peptidase domain-containing protein [Pelagovum pacificum]QQA43715.1 trypsin-like peptidase domain-containing protein [Pelagovum pacificum]TNY33154.1 peptidoglycan-binding protein [Pelagovum pacificum]
MKRRLMGLILGTVMSLPAAGWAQDGVWVQLEARRTLSGAQAAARNYASELENVSGFNLGGGYYGIALGPYSQSDALEVVRQLKARGAIPPDSYIVTGERYEQQFWPIGAETTRATQELPEALGGPEEDVTTARAETEAEVPQEPVIVEDPAPDPEEPAFVEETVAEAQQSEALLTREEKMMLQVALRWAGHYNSSIDGLYGRGTRSAMVTWQQEKGYEPTGVLTTSQRANLIADYNAVLEGMDLATVQDRQAGISMTMPTGAVKFDRYDPPFAMYGPVSEDLPARVILISQQGDEDRFYGLYEILQTLEIVPAEGERSRSSNEFTIDAIGSDVRTYVHATRTGDEIKGFMFVWPTGDEERRERILQNMRASLTTLPGTLDPAVAPPDENQGINLVSGLEMRRPVMARSGFYIDPAGSVLTASEVVEGCEQVLVDGLFESRVVHNDPELGIAVLRPNEVLSPLNYARFQTNVPRIQAPVAVAGYPFGGVMAAPAMTFGTLADIRGLNGEEEIKRLSLTAQSGDAGGPILDDGGAVLGMMLPREDGGSTVLPPDVAFAVDTDAILGSLSGAGIRISTTGTMNRIEPEALTLRASEMTVLVTCW